MTMSKSNIRYTLGILLFLLAINAFGEDIIMSGARMFLLNGWKVVRSMTIFCLV